eukprot:1045176-Pelagomonas_calceolata.AAC.4
MFVAFPFAQLVVCAELFCSSMHGKELVQCTCLAARAVTTSRAAGILIFECSIYLAVNMQSEAICVCMPPMACVCLPSNRWCTCCRLSCTCNFQEAEMDRSRHSGQQRSSLPPVWRKQEENGQQASPFAEKGQQQQGEQHPLGDGAPRAAVAIDMGQVGMEPVST